MVINETLCFDQIALVRFKKLLHVAFFERKTELSWKKVISYKSHQENEIIDYWLYVFHFELGHAFGKLPSKILLQDIDYNIFKLRVTIFPRICCCSLNYSICTNPKEPFVESSRIRQTLGIAKDKESRITSASAE